MVCEQSPVPGGAELGITLPQTRAAWGLGATRDLFLASVVLIAALVGSAKLGLALAHAHISISAVAPATGLALAAVLIAGYRMLPAVALGALLAAVTASVPFAAAIGIAAGNTVAALIAVAALRRCGFRGSLARVRDVVALGLAGIVGSTISSTAGIASLGLAGAIPASQLASAWPVWALGDISGSVLVGATLLVFAGTPRLKWREVAGLLAFSLALAAVSVLVLRYHQTLAYAILPMMLLLALVGRQYGAAIGGLIVSSIAVWFTARGHGPFVGGSLDGNLVRAQVFAIVGAGTALLVAAASSERRPAETTVRRLAGAKLAGDPTRSLFESAPSALVVVDDRGQITAVNSAAERLFGYTRSELLGTSVDRVLPMRAGATGWYRTGVGADAVADRELRGLHSDGSEFPAEISTSPIATEEGILVSVAVRDVTDRKLAADALAHQASHDPLTGLANRALFLDRLEHALARARRSGCKLAVVFLDLDDFKLVNDTRGHDVGDLLLLALAPRLSAALRPGDTIARLGGDEFVVLCEDLADEHAAISIARRMSEACSRPLAIGDYEHLVSVSAGVAMIDGGHVAEASDLLRGADAAMYRAKESGKGRIEMFDEGMRARLIVRLATESALRQALERDELRLLYQPIMSLRDSRIVGLEALLRWQHPERGMLEPSEFIAAAESSGLIVPIGEWVLQQACRQAAYWNDTASDPIYVSVNLSPRQVVRGDIVDCVARSLRSTGLDPRQLELEITESTLLEDGEACAQVLRELKAIGVRIVLDDFGTGYSSLSSLKRLTIDALKIDRSFVGGLGRDAEDGAIISAVLSMASALEVGVTAEGVETLPQLARLRAQGCEFGQGFLFSPPATAEAIGELLSGSRDVEGLTV